jgi:choline dehydrogenase-like flavoprotein
MLLHSDSLPDRSIIDSDVCIVGSGPVGLQIGRFLARHGVKVAVTESGEETASSRAQDLNIGSQTGRDAGNLRDIRIRQFGGTMHVWGGNCRPLDPADFLARDWVPNSGWPISFADLYPYFKNAHSLLNLDRYSYVPDETKLLHAADHSDSSFEETLFRLSRFVEGTGKQYLGEYGGFFREELSKNSNLKVYLGCNVTQVFLSHDKRSIEQLYAMTFQGRELHFRAKAFIFCCGGIENARLLLASQEDVSTGIGNEGDSVGRYFMEHPHGLAALMVSGRQDVNEKLRYFSPGYSEGDAVVQHRLRLTDRTQRKRGLLNLVFQIIHTSIKPHVLHNYQERFSALQSSLSVKENLNGYYVVFLSEQFPSRKSRVSLSQETDFFGMPQVNLHWDVDALDYKTVTHGLDLLLSDVFTKPDYNSVSCIARSLADWRVGHGAHHMGTTRMSASSADGVVDQDCRIHGISNGFCAGSSVFSTSGMSNPTLTAIALGLRLGQHLIANLPLMRPSDPTAPPRRPKHLDLLLAK